MSQRELISSPTSFRGLKLLGGAGRSFASAVEDPDVEGVEAVGVQAGQDAVAVVPAEGQRVLLRVVGVVFVEAALSPVVNLEDTAGGEGWGRNWDCYTQSHCVFSNAP